MEIDKIKRIAASCRARIIKQYDLYMDDSLYGFCAIASACLYTELKKHKIDCEFNISELDDQKHVYINVDSTNVDITASQFGFKAVEVNNSRETPWNSYLRFQTPAELHKYLVSIGWVEEQLFEVSEHVL